MKKKIAKTLKRLIIAAPLFGIAAFVSYLIVFKFNGGDHREAETISLIVGGIGGTTLAIIVLFYPIKWVFDNAK